MKKKKKMMVTKRRRRRRKEKLSEEVLSQYKSTISKIPVYFETVLMVTLRQVHKTEMNGEKLHSGTSYDRMYALLKSLSAQVDDLIVAAIYDHDKELAAEAARQIQADLKSSTRAGQSWQRATDALSPSPTLTSHKSYMHSLAYLYKHLHNPSFPPINN